jgi:hypothetical protein
LECQAAKKMANAAMKNSLKENPPNTRLKEGEGAKIEKSKRDSD